MDISLTENVKKELDKVSLVASYLWSKGWAERNGGNISVDLTGMISPLSEIDAAEYPFVELDKNLVGHFPHTCANRVYFVKASGSRIRDLSICSNAGLIIQINKAVTGFSILWGGGAQKTLRPTSELISHIEILESQRAIDPEIRSVVHTHPIELIALSHHADFESDSKKFSWACWSMLPEVRVFVPRGIDVIPYEIPGSYELAVATRNSLLSHDVAVWEKHGATACGKDVMDAFDAIDVANKGAHIYMKCLSANFEPKGLSQDDMYKLEELFC